MTATTSSVGMTRRIRSLIEVVLGLATRFGQTGGGRGPDMVQPGGACLERLARLLGGVRLRRGFGPTRVRTLGSVVDG